MQFIEDKIRFSACVSSKAIIRIKSHHVHIVDTTDEQYEFNGGDAEYDIKVNKQSKHQTIIIRKKYPVCPISGLPIHKNPYQFKVGYIYDKNLTLLYQPYVSSRKVYYCKIPNTTIPLYFVAKSYDTTLMTENDSIYHRLENVINSDIASLIKKYYNRDKLGCAYQMIPAASNINTKDLYHISSIRKLLDDGIFDIAIQLSIHSNSIIMLNEASYNNSSGLHIFFGSIKFMNDWKSDLLDYIKELE